MYEVNGEALQLHKVYKSCIIYYKSHENSISVLQVTRESASVLQVICAHLNVQCDNTITTIHAVPSYTYHPFAAVGIVTRAAHS